MQVKTIKDMLSRGEDPKEMLIEFCRPSCDYWEKKLKRCENKLKHMEDAKPEMSCMYPLWDWVTCVEGCVQPRIHKNLKG